MEWQFQAPEAGLALSARHAFVDLLLATCTPESDCHGSEIIFGELVANVIRHAPGPIEITMQSDAHGVVTLDVCDSGAGFTRIPSMPASPYSESGRGLYIVAKLGTQLTSSPLLNGNKVSVVLPVVAERSEIHMVKPQQAFAGLQDPAQQAQGREHPTSAQGRE